MTDQEKDEAKILKAYNEKIIYDWRLTSTIATAVVTAVVIGALHYFDGAVGKIGVNRNYDSFAFAIVILGVMTLASYIIDVVMITVIEGYNLVNDHFGRELKKAQAHNNAKAFREELEKNLESEQFKNLPQETDETINKLMDEVADEAKAVEETEEDKK